MGWVTLSGCGAGSSAPFSFTISWIHSFIHSSCTPGPARGYSYEQDDTDSFHNVSYSLVRVTVQQPSLFLPQFTVYLGDKCCRGKGLGKQVTGGPDPKMCRIN